MKYLAFILITLIPLQTIASTCETNYLIVDECYETRGRLQAANGNPSVRIWKVGTKRILGVRNENLENLPKVVKEKSAPGVFIFADYKVCPLTKDKPGHMQMVCVESMKNIRIEDYRENIDEPVIIKILPNVPVVTKKQNEPEKRHAVELLLIIMAIFTMVMLLLLFLKTKRKPRKDTETLIQESNYQSSRESHPQKEPACIDQQKSLKTENKTKALSEAAVKEQINSFPLAKVEHIIDGDTVIVVKNWQKIRIRLYSIDCPEVGQHWGDTAKYGLIKLIGGRKVRLEEHGIDAYERILATIYVQQGHGSEWMNVNERMVTLGHAWVMRRFQDCLPKDRQNKLNRLENWAKSKKVGMWQTPNQIPPWKWRSEDEVS